MNILATLRQSETTLDHTSLCINHLVVINEVRVLSRALYLLCVVFVKMVSEQLNERLQNFKKPGRL